MVTDRKDGRTHTLYGTDNIRSPPPRFQFFNNVFRFSPPGRKSSFNGLSEIPRKKNHLCCVVDRAS